MDKPEVKYCKKCVVPSSSAIPIEFDDNGICSGCNTSNQKDKIDWQRRGKQFKELLQEYKSKDGSNYDCIIPVSGGKDSYFQTHIIKNVYGMNPLLITYHGNNYTKEGMDNLINMREVFGVDHIFFTPSIDVLKKMNRLGMRIMGDMNWHAHAGIFTYPIRCSVQLKIPLVIWGEHGFMDIGGMHSYNDYVEFTYRYRHEHALRGYEWEDFVKAAATYGEKLTKEELISWMYPKDKEIAESGSRGIFLSNYVEWDANKHGAQMIKDFGFKPAKKPFERTYRVMSNLDDMHENGIHDYMKFVKFGYGRATDHVCKDIRAGIMTRDEGIKIIKKMDPIKPKDLKRWLKYVGWTESEFDKVADTFRDPRVWWIKNNHWWKDNIGGGCSDYGPVHLSKKDRARYITENK